MPGMLSEVEVEVEGKRKETDGASSVPTINNLVYVKQRLLIRCLLVSANLPTQTLPSLPLILISTRIIVSHSAWKRTNLTSPLPPSPANANLHPPHPS